jgi:hypothetical protein
LSVSLTEPLDGYATFRFNFTESADDLVELVFTQAFH